MPKTSPPTRSGVWRTHGNDGCATKSAGIKLAGAFRAASGGSNDPVPTGISTFGARPSANAGKSPRTVRTAADCGFAVVTRAQSEPRRAHARGGSTAFGIGPRKYCSRNGRSKHTAGREGRPARTTADSLRTDLLRVAAFGPTANEGSGRVVDGCSPAAAGFRMLIVLAASSVHAGGSEATERVVNPGNSMNASVATKAAAAAGGAVTFAGSQLRGNSCAAANRGAKFRGSSGEP